MYYKRDDYKFQSGGFKVIIPADAPSGWSVDDYVAGVIIKQIA